MAARFASTVANNAPESLTEVVCAVAEITAPHSTAVAKAPSDTRSGRISDVDLVFVIVSPEKFVQRV
jgi:hypothetical protein